LQVNYDIFKISVSVFPLYYRMNYFCSNEVDIGRGFYVHLCSEGILIADMDKLILKLKP